MLWQQVHASLRVARGGSCSVNNSLGGRFEEPLHQAPLVVFQQGEIEAVVVGAAAAPAFVHRLQLHQRAVGVVENHKTLPTAKEEER